LRTDADVQQGSASQRDLFSSSNVPPATDAKEICGTIAVSTVDGEISIGVDKVDTPEAAAHVLASLRKSPMERFFVLALDKDKKPHAILRASQGSINQAVAFPHTVISAAYSVPDVKYIWYAAHGGQPVTTK